MARVRKALTMPSRVPVSYDPASEAWSLPLDRIEVMKEDIGAAVRTALPNAEIGVNVTPRAAAAG